MQLIPAILAKDPLEFSKKLDILDGTVEMVQIDIMDGNFVPETTFQDLDQASSAMLEYELHLMVENPEEFIEQWQDVPNVKRAIIHAEIKKPLQPIIDQIHDLGWEAGIAINPETSWKKIEKYLKEIETVLVMTVHPGKSGQPFEETVKKYNLLEKIKDLHHARPSLTISIDGGVNEETIPYLMQAGATRFTAGSAIFNDKDLIENYKKLEEVIMNEEVGSGE
ncbi:MAG: Ribulose-phosphate 3-epimerase [Parcubacteria group bacterium GW2011_GWC2_39_11]|nr:MAG: Ribulose-phosphate 3-epimerase [Parcubacteria group bacterium GW2011_GWC2_39_11]